MLVVSRFVVGPAPDDAAPDDAAAPKDFAARARAALASLAARPGYVRGRLGRSIDEPAYWCLVTEWESVGAYRRALSAYDVKVRASTVLAEALDEPSGYEVLARTDGAGEVVVTASDRAPDADR